MPKKNTRTRKRTPLEKISPSARPEAIAYLTDEDVRKALARKREYLIDRLGDVLADRMMPDWESNSLEMIAQNKINEAVLTEAIDDIDRRKEGASKVLRDFGGRDLKPQA